jgi:hypothetical protein
MTGREHCRERGIAPKTYDDGRRQSTQKLTCLYSADRQLDERLSGPAWSATEASGAHAMGFNPRKTSGNRISTPIARQMDFAPTAQQFTRQRLGWK